MCSHGVKTDLYYKLFCTDKDCPSGLAYKHSSFGNTKFHKREWDWDWSKDGYHCRMVIEADTALNGKINLEVVNNGW